MKKIKILYWSTTGVISSVMLWSALNFSLNPEMKGAFARFGLPDWFRIELTVAKLLGAAVLLLPAIPRRVKEFAYFGFGLVLISAPIAHLSSGDSLKLVIGHLSFLLILKLSYDSWNKVRDPAAASSAVAGDSTLPDSAKG
jgi:hypothetical protein